MILVEDTCEPYMGNLELIADKIAPPRRLPRVTRQRLLGLLAKSLASGTSTIISGRAGTGKTTLVTDFAQQCGRDIAWYKIDAPDADPLVFFSYLISAIQERVPGFGRRSLLALVGVTHLEQMTWLADSFVYELSEVDSSKPLLIVIEDLHLVSDAEWLVPFFGRLLPLLPSNVHLLITSRNLPTPPLWRMRSKQSLVLIDESTLAFTRAEAVALFESYGLTAEEAAIALDHAHGRAGALDEAAISLLKSMLNPASSSLHEAF
jgi:LuxR family maltose regulon positive regulatory protein